MSYWMMAAATGSVVVLAVTFAFLIFRLDDAIEKELRLAEQDQRWTSII
jgi:hypothetical protein